LAAISRTGKKQKVHEAIAANRSGYDVVGARTNQVICQFLQVWKLVVAVTINPMVPHRFVWRWSSDGKFSISSSFFR